MEGIMLFVSIIIIIFGILQIILFFKVWGMTNDVKKVKNIMEMKFEQEISNKNIIDNDFQSDIKVGDSVVELKNERQLKVCAITIDGKYKCKVAGGIVEVGTFDRSEIELFEKYWDKK